MPRIFDCVMYDGERVLDLRLRTLWQVVDYFVIAEMELTHTGKEKDILFRPEDFEWASSKIRYLKLDGARFSHCKTAWDRERLHRHLLTDGLGDADDDDVVLSSDVDEIPNPCSIVDNISNIDRSIAIFDQLLFYFYYDYMCISSPVWYGTRMFRAKILKDHDLNQIRSEPQRLGLPIINIEEGGWHFSYLGGIDKIVSKLNRFAHQEYNTPFYKEKSRITKRISLGKDIFGRPNRFGRVSHAHGPKEMIEWFSKYPDSFAGPEVALFGDASDVVRDWRSRPEFLRKIQRRYLQLWNRI